MKIADRVEVREMSLRAAGIACVAAAVCVFAAMPAMAQSGAAQDQDQRSGVSHPPSAPITADSDDVAPAPVKAKPSPMVPMTNATTPAKGQRDSGEFGRGVWGVCPVPRAGHGSGSDSAKSSLAFDPDANIVTEATAGRAERHELNGAAAKNDPDAGIVTQVMPPPGEIGEGTLVKAKLRETLSTESTRPGTRFSAVVSEAVLREGQVIIPAGSVMDGRVTSVHSGTRFNGGAAIHLEPRAITLPDGSTYVVRARVIDTGDWDKTKVDEEGTIEHRGSAKKTAAVIGLATGGGAAAGAMMGGLPGAVIGAGVGAGAATVVWLKQDTQAELPKELELVFSLTEPMSVTPIGMLQGTMRAAVREGRLRSAAEEITNEQIENAAQVSGVFACALELR